MGLKVEIFLWFLGFSFCFLFVFLESQTQENLRKKKENLSPSSSPPFSHPALYHRGSFAPVCPSVRPSLRIILRALRAGVSLVSSAPFYSLVSSAPFYSSVTLSPDFRSVSSAPIYSPASPAPGSRCVSSAPLPSAEASSSGLLKKEIPPGASLRSIRSTASALRAVTFLCPLHNGPRAGQSVAIGTSNCTII